MRPNGQFGSKFRAELNTVKKLEFTDKNQVVALLRRLQLLAKTLVPTQSTVEDLLKDPAVSEEAKTQLRALAREIEQTDLHITGAE